MNAQLPTPNAQTETTKATKRSKNTKTAILKKWLFVSVSACSFFVVFVVETTAQQQLDRVVARIATSALTQTDVDAALAFGVVDRQAGDPVKQMIERRLIIVEINRFPPPEPGEMAINELVAKMKATAGAQTAAVMKRTGVDEKRLAEFARETLRIQAYLAQRFGNGPRAEQQRAQWLDGLRARADVTEFTPPR
jgi:hypothetical protein